MSVRILKLLEKRNHLSGKTKPVYFLLSYNVCILGLRFGAAAYKKGQREGSIVVYEADMYPCGAIGPVQFMWKAKLDNIKVSLFAITVKIVTCSYPPMPQTIQKLGTTELVFTLTNT